MSINNFPSFTALHNKSRVMSAEMREYTIELERLLRLATVNAGSSVLSVARSANSRPVISQNDYVRVDTWTLNQVKQVEKRVAITRIDMGVNGELVLAPDTEVGEIRF